MSDTQNVSEDRSSKTEITGHQKGILEAAGIKPDELFSRYEVQKSDEEPQVDDHTSDPNVIDDVTAPEAGQEGSTEPSKQLPQGLSEPDDEGYRHLKIGKLDIRVDTDGNPMVRTKVNGEEGWIKDDMFLRGYQLNQANNLKAEELAAEAKRLKDLEDSLLYGDALSKRMFKSDTPKGTLDGDNLEDEFFPKASGNEAVDTELARIREENELMKKKLDARDEEEKAKTEQMAMAQRGNEAHKEMVEWCTEKSITPPSLETLQKDIIVFAENQGKPWQEIAQSASGMIKLAKYSLAKSNRNSSQTGETSDTPPSAVPAGGRGAKPKPKEQIDKEIASIRARSHKGGSDPHEDAASLIALSRQKNLKEG